MDQHRVNQISGASGSNRLKVLFAASEAQPLIKTGGLADVAGSLPLALRQRGVDARLVIPAYPDAISHAADLREVARFQLKGQVSPIRLLMAKLKSLPVYLVDAPGLFDRAGNPYVDKEGNNWPDNADRFYLFCQAVCALSLNRAGLNWRPELVHCNDWQTGLVPAMLNGEWNRPTTLFTIHNLAYQGVFDHNTFVRLDLPRELWHHQALEYHGSFSFIKGGLAFADLITTVSPTYAREILTGAFGCGLDGLLRHRADRLHGVLNGIDYQLWDPGNDPCLRQSYDINTLPLKQRNKVALQKQLELEVDADRLLLAHIGRLVPQKGADLILDILPGMLEQHAEVQLVVLGSGERAMEQRLTQASRNYPGRVSTIVGYDEVLAHRIEAAADLFLMPSRFEPCGLNQLYSLRYGTLPLVHATGGLADTVVNTEPSTLLDGSATGFSFTPCSSQALWDCLQQALAFRQRPAIWWEKLQRTAMKQDYSWDRSADRYLQLYQQAMENPAASPLGKDQ